MQHLFILPATIEKHMVCSAKMHLEWKYSRVIRVSQKPRGIYHIPRRCSPQRETNGNLSDVQIHAVQPLNSQVQHLRHAYEKYLMGNRQRRGRWGPPLHPCVFGPSSPQLFFLQIIWLSWMRHSQPMAANLPHGTPWFAEAIYLGQGFVLQTPLSCRFPLCTAKACLIVLASHRRRNSTKSLNWACLGTESISLVVLLPHECWRCEANLHLYAML